jgi:plastocyanin
VTIAEFAFKPNTLTVKVGAPVEWTNNDSFAHSIRSTDSAFDEKAMAKGEKATVTFSKARTYAYLCGIHNSMTGTVVVEA